MPWVTEKILADSRLSDADLKYLYHGPAAGKRVRPCKYAGETDTSNIYTSYFELVGQNPGATLYSTVLYSKSMKQMIGLAHVIYTSGKWKTTRKLYFSTGTYMGALEILCPYKGRFQIEFLYRGCKQHTGLTGSQARNENKLRFKFNAALTAINIAKVEHWLNVPKEVRKPFSINDTKPLIQSGCYYSDLLKCSALMHTLLKIEIM